jgi:hypothetical protein
VCKARAALYISRLNPEERVCAADPCISPTRMASTHALADVANSPRKRQLTDRSSSHGEISILAMSVRGQLPTSDVNDRPDYQREKLPLTGVLRLHRGHSAIDEQ